MAKKFKLSIEYNITESDSDWMSSSTLEEESLVLEVDSWDELLLHLETINDVTVNSEIKKELHYSYDQDKFKESLETNPDLYLLFTDSESSGFICVDTYLKIKRLP
jgi:hypothetical protein